jgi:hypothetical protein
VPEGYCNVEDLAGDFVGGRTLQAGEDAAMVARQILREKHPRFNRRLEYPNLGIV